MEADALDRSEVLMTSRRGTDEAEATTRMPPIDDDADGCPAGTAPRTRRMTDTHLISKFDALLADLDGVVYAGPHAIPGAVESLRRLDGIGVGLGYVTNNASRTPAQVAQHLRDLGAPAEDHQVVSSSQAAGELLASLLPAGARVLITGGAALAHEIELVGLVPVRSEAENPVAVVQGFHPDVGWKDLAEAAYVVAGGALWVATNTDMSIPQARGIAPGNGTLVAAVAAATGQRPWSPASPRRRCSTPPRNGWPPTGRWSSATGWTPTSWAGTRPASPRWPC